MNLQHFEELYYSAEEECCVHRNFHPARASELRFHQPHPALSPVNALALALLRAVMASCWRLIRSLSSLIS